MRLRRETNSSGSEGAQKHGPEGMELGRCEMPRRQQGKREESVFREWATGWTGRHGAYPEGTEEY